MCTYGRTYGVIGYWRGGVEHSFAAVDGAAERVVVEQVGLAEDQPLRGAVQRLQVRVLGVVFSHQYSQSVKYRSIPCNTNLKAVLTF